MESHPTKVVGGTRSHSCPGHTILRSKDHAIGTYSYKSLVAIGYSNSYDRQGLSPGVQLTPSSEVMIATPSLSGDPTAAKVPLP